eukprot:COSAG04_NODE_524_length_13127_cov_18.191511_6_plen_158_part_00
MFIMVAPSFEIVVFPAIRRYNELERALCHSARTIVVVNQFVHPPGSQGRLHDIHDCHAAQTPSESRDGAGGQQSGVPRADVTQDLSLSLRRVRAFAQQHDLRCIAAQCERGSRPCSVGWACTCGRMPPGAIIAVRVDWTARPRCDTGLDKMAGLAAP